MLKKVFYLVFVVLVLFNMQGCKTANANTPKTINSVTVTDNNDTATKSTPNTKENVKVNPDEAIKLIAKYSALRTGYAYSTEGYQYDGIDPDTGYYLISWANPGIGTGGGWTVNPFNGDVYQMDNKVFNLFDAPKDETNNSEAKNEQVKSTANNDNSSVESPIDIESQNDSEIVIKNYTCKDIEHFLNTYFDVHQTVGFQYITSENNFAYFDLPSTVNGFGNPLIEVKVSTKDGEVKYSDDGQQIKDKTIGYIDSLIKATSVISAEEAENIVINTFKRPNIGAQAFHEEKNDIQVNGIEYYYFDIAYGLLMGDTPKDEDNLPSRVFINNKNKSIYEVIEKNNSLTLGKQISK